MTGKVKRSFRFDAAHRIAGGYIGKCSSLHGHSYCYTIHIAGSTNDNGIIVDDAIIALIQEWVNKFLNGATIVAESDSQLADALNAFDNPLQKTYVIPVQSTSVECLVEYITGIVINYVLPCSSNYFVTGAQLTASNGDTSYYEVININSLKGSEK